MTFKLIILFIALLELTNCTTTESNSMNSNDIKLKTIGLMNGKFITCNSKPNCVVSDSNKNKGQYIEPIKLGKSLKQDDDAIMYVLKNALKSYSNAKIISSTNNYLHAEFKSSLFGFVDDVEFYFSDVDQAGSTKSKIIHVKSASRVGYSDFGANRRRVEVIREQISNL